MRGVIDIRPILDALPELDVSAPASLRQFLAVVCTTFNLDMAGMYAPTPRAQHWDLEFGEWMPEPTSRASFVKMLQECASDEPSFAAYDPFAVDPGQRNHAVDELELQQLDKSYARAHLITQQALDLRGEHQLRALLCDGPRLLAWFGLLQSSPFSPCQRAAFEALLLPVQEHLRAQRSARFHAFQAAILDTLLANMSEPASIVRKDGQVVMLNKAAERSLYTEEGRRELKRLHAAVRQGLPCSPFRIVPISGAPDHVLALRELTTLRDTASSLARAKMAWGLSSRDTRIVELLLGGHSNKDIANTLDCAEVSVERYLTRLFRASKTRTRGELVAAVHRV